MTDLLTDLDFKTKKATKPPTRWFVDLHVLDFVTFQTLGGDVECDPGDLVVLGPYPSHEIAESQVRDMADIAKLVRIYSETNTN